MSRVRRRFSEFVWLRQRLQANSMLMAQVPQLPPKNPFFSLNNAQQISERMAGLQRFLEQILQSPQLLSDSCLHLFLQSELSMAKMEACAEGRTRYSVAQAVQCCGIRRFLSQEALQKDSNISGDSDSDSSECRGSESQFKEDLALKQTSPDHLGTEQEQRVCSSLDSA
ncbi:sorting nexin-10B isoform X2 [Hippocampus zosterae]|nr:sorting nexin-10B isoform X2 [Hippocampus zosterae]XP_051922687.1 sorting nexin-10B isoform X2 [Hippocampus zosterae]